MRYVYLDTETGGLDPKIHGITEIAAVAFYFDPKNPFDRPEIQDEFQVIIRPNQNLAYTPYALHMQDRTLQYLEEYGVPESEAWEGFEAFLHTHLKGNWQGKIIAHHARFDYDFLAALAARWGRASVLPAGVWCEWICTKNLFRLLSGLGIVPITKCGLSDIMKWYGLEFEGKQHTALVDVKAGIPMFRHEINDLKKFYEGSK